jgi:uncharacterized protein involved in exopolysaccharide biosynthesis
MIDYIYILYKWRKILFINMLTVTVLAIIISFIIPKTYKATSTVILPSDNPMGLGGLGNILSGGSSALEIGAEVFGITRTNEDLILGLLMSRTILSDVIDKYNLMDYYGIDENNYDKAIKVFVGDLIFEPNEYGMIEVSVIHEDPEVSASMVRYFIKKADSLNIKLNITQAKNNRELIENRYKENLKDLELAENNFKEFQKKYGAFAVPEQIKVAVQAIGELEAQLMQQNILLNSLAENLNENSILFKSIQNNINAIKSEIRNLERKKESSSDGLLLRLDNLPEIQIEYIRKYRDLEIQNKTLEFIYPLYEQAKLEEKRSIPTMLVVDEAVPPQLNMHLRKLL